MAVLVLGLGGPDAVGLLLVNSRFLTCSTVAANSSSDIGGRSEAPARPCGGKYWLVLILSDQPTRERHSRAQSVKLTLAGGHTTLQSSISRSWD